MNIIHFERKGNKCRKFISGLYKRSFILKYFYTLEI